MRVCGFGLLLGGVASCDIAPEPDPCADMCMAAAELYGGCLTDWGAGWEAAGYTDEEDFLDACSTWAWELRILEQDAVDQGLIDQTGQVDATCAERQAAFVADEATCSTYTSIDWNDAPWIEETGDSE
jgi:hypothetical protein